MNLTAAASVGIANLLSEPKQQAELHSQYPLGEKFSVINKNDSYYQVETEDDLTGWLHKGSVIVQDEPNNEDLQDNKLICVSPFSILRTKESRDSEGVHQVFLGTVLSLDEPITNYYLKNHNWLRVMLPDASFAFLEKKDFMVYSNYRERCFGKSKTAIDTAMHLLGVPYLWGGTTPAALDCSGLIQLAYRMAGKKLPRNSYQQAETGEPFNTGDDLESAEPGDLIFFSDNKRISHVGMLIEGSRFIHASLTYGKVVITSFSKKDREYNEFFRNIYRFARRHEWRDNI